MKTFLRFLPILILLLAFGLRVYKLGDLNLNWDEGYSNWLVRQPFAQMLETTARDVHPPVYYLALRAQRLFTGDGEFVLRFPSVLFGILTVAVVYALGKSVGGKQVGLLAMLLFGLSRANIDISQLMRMHMLAGLFSAGALWATVQLFRFRPKQKRYAVWQILYVICVLGALHTFYLAVVLPLATNLAFLVVWVRRKFPRRFLIAWLIPQIAAAVLFLPWALYAIQRMHGWSAEQPTSFGFFLQVYFVTLTTGIPADWGNVLPLVGVVLIILLIGIGAIFTRAHRGHRDSLILLLAGLLMPVLVVFLLTLPIHNLGRPLAVRYLLMLSSCFYVLLAWSIVKLASFSRILGIGALVIVLSASLIGLRGTYEGRVLRDVYVSVAHTLRAHRQAGDAVVLHNDRAWTVLAAEYHDDWVNVPYQQPVDAGFADYLLTPLWENSDAIWLIKNDESLVNDPQDAIVMWLEDHAEATTIWAFNDSTLTLYTKTPERTAIIYDLAPDFVPPQNISNVEGLIGADLPMHEYPIGDNLIFALYWQTPPQTAFTMRLIGEVERDFTIEPPSSASAGFTRQQISLPLTPDLPVGQYHIYWGDVELAQFRLVNLTTNAQAVAADIEHPLDFVLGESIHLRGYTLDSDQLRPGATLDVTLFWEADTALTERYKVSVFLLGEQFNPATNNPLWGQQDAEPLNWTLPTTRWQPNVIIADRYTFQIPENTPPGNYTLGVALYGFIDGVRLGAYNANNTPIGDFIPIETINVP